VESLSHTGRQRFRESLTVSEFFPWDGSSSGTFDVHLTQSLIPWE
jgi:hypothetical protein